jgi:hypothetical protein
MEYTKQMIDDIEASLNCQKTGNEYDFPIEELDGIKVGVKFRKVTWHDASIHYYFLVGMTDVHHISDTHLNGRYNLFSSEDLLTLPKALAFSLIFFQNFKVDLFAGKFITTSRPITETSSKIAAMLRKNPRIKTTFEECCVCKDTETNTTTPCGHFVCIRCISKLPKNEDDPDHDCEDSDENCIDRHCPMCRQAFCRID